MLQDKAIRLLQNTRNVNDLLELFPIGEYQINILCKFSGSTFSIEYFYKYIYIYMCAARPIGAVFFFFFDVRNGLIVKTYRYFFLLRRIFLQHYLSNFSIEENNVNDEKERHKYLMYNFFFRWYDIFTYYFIQIRLSVFYVRVNTCF